MFGPNFWQNAIIAAPVILLSVTVHEFSHAWTASRFGDDTARRMGRISLNPLVHLDFMGTLAMIISGFRFGWAKPVPINPMNLRNPRVADIWISAAGPASNFGLAVIGGLLFQLLPPSPFLIRVLHSIVIINITLGLFNLIPLFPLDGSHILKNLLPARYEPALERFDRISPFLLLIIIFTGVFWMVLGPIAMSLARILLGY